MSKLALIGLVIAALGVPASATAVHERHSHACQSLSEMVSCGKHGVRGNRAQFVAAISRPVDNAFLCRTDRSLSGGSTRPLPRSLHRPVTDGGSPVL